MKLRTRLLIAFLMISITPFAIIGTISLLTSESALSELAFGHLENMREVKKTQIQMFLAERKVNMDILMKTVANFRQAAFEKLKTVQEIKKAQVEKYFHKCLNDITVLSENANVQELGVFDAVLDGKGGVRKEVYAFHEEQYFGNSLKQFRDTYGHADLLLITKNGDIVYTVARGSDLGQNLLTGPLKNSSLGQCFQEGLKGTTIRDFEPYSPTDNRYMAFVAAPVLKYGVIAGVVALRLDNHGLNTTVQRRKGMGKTGETYVAGRQNDKISYRSDRKIKEGKIGQTISEDYVETALSGQSGTAVRIDNKGGMNFISYDPLEISGLNWAIITTLSLEEVVAPRLEGEEEDYFAMYIKDYGYDDLFLIHPRGYIFYSVGRHPDYGTNILTGTYSDSGLGRLVREIRETKKFGFADFEPYEPYEGKPAAFIAQPLVSDDNVELVVALQLSLDTINKVMGGRAGMGETGETYLVGPDRLMRSDSHSDPVDHSAYASFANPEKGRVDTRPAQESLAGKTGRVMARNYNDQKVLSAYTPLDIWDKTWSLIAEIPAEEAFAAVKALKWVTGVIAIIAIAVIIIISFVLAGYIAKPVASLTSAVREVSDGNLFVSAPVSTNKELGLLALTFNKMTKRLRETLDSLRAEIVERKKTEEEKEKQKQLLDATGSIANVGGWSIDVKTNELTWTEEVYRIFEIEGEFNPTIESAIQFWVPESRAIIASAVETLLNTGESYDLTLEIKTAKDNFRWAHTIGKVNLKDGKIVSFSGSIQDITELKQTEKKRKELEDKLQQSQKMESIGTLAGGIAHDFNNILFPIVGHSEMLMEDIPEDSPFQENLQEIYTASLRAKELVKQIMTFSRQESRDLKLMRMQPIIKEALKFIRSTIPTTIDIKQDLQADCSQVKADPTEIHQIIMNLATNGYHAMKETGGELKVGLKEVNLEETDLINPDMEPGVYALLTISDQGTGMDKDVVKKIFDPFFTTKEKGKGTGMGLSVVHGIVKSMKGEIIGYSEPGVGTEFKVYFPVEKNSFIKTNHQTKTNIQSGTEKILLVDDEESILIVEKRLLMRLGYQVTSYGNSLEALENFRSNPVQFDLVISDMAMPGLSGDKLSVELLKISPDIPILLCTGFSDGLSEGKYTSLGIKGLLMKPIAMKDLAQKIREVLDDSKNMSQQ